MSPPPDSPHGRREATQAFPLIGRQGWISVVISLSHTHRKLFSDFTSTYEYQLEKKKLVSEVCDYTERQITQHAKSLLKRITEIEAINAKDKSSLYRTPHVVFLDSSHCQNSGVSALCHLTQCYLRPHGGVVSKPDFPLRANNTVYQKKIKG